MFNFVQLLYCMNFLSLKYIFTYTFLLDFNSTAFDTHVLQLTEQKHHCRRRCPPSGKNIQYLLYPSIRLHFPNSEHFLHYSYTNSTLCSSTTHFFQNLPLLDLYCVLWMIFLYAMILCQWKNKITMSRVSRVEQSNCMSKMKKDGILSV